MGRWAVGIVLILLVAVAGLGWRAIGLSQQLGDTKVDLKAATSRIQALEQTSGNQSHELEETSSHMRALTKPHKRVRGELRDRQPCADYPRLILSPSSGPPGTRVSFIGYCFTGDYKDYDLSRDEGYGLFIMNPAQD